MILSFALAAFFITEDTLPIEVRLADKPLSGQKVRMIGFKDGVEKYSETRITDVSGRAIFSFSIKEPMNLIAETLFDNLSYYSDPIFDKPYPKKLMIKVFKSSPMDERARIEDLRVFVKADREGIVIDEEILIQNLSPFTLVGKSTPEGAETLRIGLPNGAHDLKFGFGFEEKETRFDGNDIVSSHPLLPGYTRFSFRYALERSALSAEFQRSFSLPVERVSFASPNDFLKISGANITEGPQKFFGGEMAKTFTGLIQKRDFKLTLGGLPLKFRYSQALPFILLLLLIVLAWPLQAKIGPEWTEAKKTECLRELVLLKRLKESSLIDEEEFQRRRLRVLEEIFPFYST